MVRPLCPRATGSAKRSPWDLSGQCPRPSQLAGCDCSKTLLEAPSPEVPLCRGSQNQEALQGSPGSEDVPSERSLNVPSSLGEWGKGSPVRPAGSCGQLWAGAGLGARCGVGKEMGREHQEHRPYMGEERV